MSNVQIGGSVTAGDAVSAIHIIALQMALAEQSTSDNRTAISRFLQDQREQRSRKGK